MGAERERKRERDRENEKANRGKNREIELREMRISRGWHRFFIIVSLIQAKHNTMVFFLENSRFGYTGNDSVDEK